MLTMERLSGKDMEERYDEMGGHGVRLTVAEILHKDEQLLSCLVCELEYASMEDLKDHVTREHGMLSQPLPCDLCGREFKQRNRLERHKRAVHEKQRPFECKFCNILFAEKNNLAAHTETVHERKRPFACALCHAAFGRKNNLQRHIQTVHEKRRPFQCSRCNMCFGEKGNLLTHERRKHTRPKTEVFLDRNCRGSNSNSFDTSE